MNIIAIDIGNTTITVGLFLDDTEKSIESVAGADPDAASKIGHILTEAWQQVPVLEISTEGKRDGIIVASSVKAEWTAMVTDVCQTCLDEKVRIIGQDLSLPIETSLSDPKAIGTDRLINAAAAFAVIEDACVVASIGTAITIDLIDEQGVFHGGVIAPGLAMGAKAMHEYTSKLPQIEVKECSDPVGKDTESAMNAGVIFAAVGLLRMMTEKYAEQVGRWPHLVVTGGASHLLRNQCDFVDTWIKDLAVRGVVLAYKKYVADQAEAVEFDELNQQHLKNPKDKPNMN